MDTEAGYSSQTKSLMKLISFAGKAGSGKSTLSRYLVDNHGFTLVKFADVIKDMLRVLGLTDYEIEGEGKEKSCYLLGGKTPRYAMQTLGTEWGRETMYPLIWIDAWYRRANDVLQSGGKVVCDDVRFGNEAEAIWKLNGYVFEVLRPQQDQITKNSHPSEIIYFSCDATLINNETITELCEKLEIFL